MTRAAITTTPVLLVLGGSGVAALRRTLEVATACSSRIFSAVATPEEIEATLGLSDSLLLDPWPEQLGALDALVDAAQLGRDDLVQTVLAGSEPDRASLHRASRSRVGLIVPLPMRWGLARLFGARGLRRAVLRPGGGMTIRGGPLLDLRAGGWLRGVQHTVAEVAQATGRIKLVQAHPHRLPVPVPRPRHARADRVRTVAVLIPAFDEQGSVGDTVRSLFKQTRMPDQVIVIDDGSSDRTGDVASHAGAEVIRTAGTGSKGAAINAALPTVDADVVVLVDADTRLHPDAIEQLLRTIDAGADATHGSVLPAVERGFWARGRLIEYALSRRIFKRTQHALGQIMVLSGCILAVRLDALRAVGGFQSRTMVEDLDLTWTLHEQGFRVEYSPRALAYPIEPETWATYAAQMRRWARGFFQAVRIHGRMLPRTRGLALIVVTSIWDIVTTPLLMIVFLGLLILGMAPSIPTSIVFGWQLLWTVFAVTVAATVMGARRALLAAPGYIAICTLSTYFYFEAFTTEWILRRRLTTWVKGH